MFKLNYFTSKIEFFINKEEYKRCINSCNMYSSKFLLAFSIIKHKH